MFRDTITDKIENIISTTARSVKNDPLFQVNERNLVIFKDTLMNNHVNRPLSTRSFH